MSEITGLSHIDLTVTDPVASAKWYCDVLGMEQAHDLVERPTTKIISVRHQPTRLVIGLMSHSEGKKEKFDEKVTGLDHLCFLVDGKESVEEWAQRLTDKDVEHSGVNENRLAWLVTFRDPDNIQLEIAARKNP